jgi:hypothetical protein
MMTAPSAPDLILAQVGEAIARTRTDRLAARDLLASLWDVVGMTGDALHRVAIAHAMADVQDGPQEELMWDLRALAAADQLDDARLEAAGMAAQVADLVPSLHLNLADVYRRLGDAVSARVHVAQAHAAIRNLVDGGAATMIRDALDRVAMQLPECGAGNALERVGSKPAKNTNS